MNIVCLGQQGWHVTRTAKQHLLGGLARRGHRILYVDPLQSDPPPATGNGWLADVWPPRSLSGVSEVEPGVHVLTLPRPRLPRAIAKRLPSRVVAGVVRRLGLDEPIVVCSWPSSRWLGGRIDASARVYLAYDDNAAFGNLPPSFAEHQRREEQRALAESQVALAVSPALVERFEKVVPRSYLQENGVDVAAFDPAALAGAAPHPIYEAVDAALPERAGVAGFVGQLDERMDQSLVLGLARSRRDVAFVFAGRLKESVDFSAFEAEPNVFLTGPVPYRELPGVYRGFTVGLVPYVRSELTRACNPLKAYEYLAAGLPVVATALEGLNSVRGVAAVCESHEAFAASLDRALAEPGVGLDARRSLAASADWASRVEMLEARLNEAREVAGAARR